MSNNEYEELGTLISFDLSQEKLKRYYSINSPQNAYREIKQYLVKNGFDATKDSDYKSTLISIENALDIIDKFSLEKKWFPLSLNKLTISPFKVELDVTEQIKVTYTDLTYKNEKDKQYEKTLDFKIHKLKSMKNNKEKIKEHNNHAVKKDIVHNLNNKKNNRQKER